MKRLAITLESRIVAIQYIGVLYSDQVTEDNDPLSDHCSGSLPADNSAARLRGYTLLWLYDTSCTGIPTYEAECYFVAKESSVNK